MLYLPTFIFPAEFYVYETPVHFKAKAERREGNAFVNSIVLVHLTSSTAGPRPSPIYPGFKMTCKSGQKKPFIFLLTFR